VREHESDAAPASEAPASDELTRTEEELELGTASRVAGSVRARKRVEHRTAKQLVDREIEHLDEVEHVPPHEGDSGEIETLEDGSVSIPIFEEELVVSKRTVVRERIVIRKRTETERQRVEANVRKERIVLDADGAI
jgi:uncharacterized protein (TIGR02271 family)